MCSKDTNEYGSLCKEGDNWIEERRLLFISRIYNRLLIVFHIGIRNRQIKLYFPDLQTPSFSFDIDNYNHTLNHQIRDIQRQKFAGGNYFDDLFHQLIIKNINQFTNGETEITPKTKVEDIINCF
jgi:hypothetical protein